MTNRKKYTLGVIFIICIFVLSSLIVKSNLGQEKYDGTASLLFNLYETTEDLVDESDEIIIGKVKKVHKPHYTKIDSGSTEEEFYSIDVSVDIEVIKKLKGYTESKQIITLDYAIGTKVDNDKFEYKEIKKILNGEELILFLNKYDDHPSYFLVSQVQGMLKIKDNKSKNNKSKVKDLNLDISREYFPMFDEDDKVEDIENKIREALK